MYYIFLEKASIFLFICDDLFIYLFIYQRDTFQDGEPYLLLTSNQSLVYLEQRSILVLERLEFLQRVSISPFNQPNKYLSSSYLQHTINIP